MKGFVASFTTFTTNNGFLLFLCSFSFGRGFVYGEGLLTKSLGQDGFLFWALFLLKRLRTVEGASILVTPKASQKFPISFQDWALSDPYFDCSLISLQRFNPSDLTMPNSLPKDNKLNGISLVAKFWRSLLRILSPKSFGSPTINLSFQNC